MSKTLDIKDDLSFDEWYALFAQRMLGLGYAVEMDKYCFEWYYDDGYTSEGAARDYWEELKEGDDGYLDIYGSSIRAKVEEERKELDKNHQEQIKQLGKELDFALSKAHNEGVLMGLKMCKEEWAQGEISHESICKNEEYFKSVLGTVMKEYDEFMKSKK